MIEKFRGKYRWLSNFWAAPVLLDGLLFPTVEHAYQASKVLSPEIRERIRALPSAACAKKFGKRIGKSIPFRPAWSDDFKTELMRDLLTQKFTNPDFRQRLITTGDELLVESNHWHDNWFGRCDCSRCGGRGRNMLGILLMEVRAECRRQDANIKVAADWRLDHAA